MIKELKEHPHNSPTKQVITERPAFGGANVQFIDQTSTATESRLVHLTEAQRAEKLEPMQAWRTPALVGEMIKLMQYYFQN